MTKAHPQQAACLPAEPPPDALSVDTNRAAEMIGISRRMLMEYIYSGEIKTSKIPSIRSGQPNMHLIKVSELRAFLDRYQTST